MNSVKDKVVAPVVISGSGFYAPENTISNDELVDTFNQYVEKFNQENAERISSGEVEALKPSSTDFIKKASGIERRHVLEKTGILDSERMKPYVSERDNSDHSIQCEMSVYAIKDALESANKSVEDVDCVIVSCAALERAYPAVATEVQSALGMTGFSFDMSVACSSATFGIQMANDLVAMGRAKCAVVVSPEICSSWIAWEDRDCHFIFGDACTAVVVESAENASASNVYEIVSNKAITEFSNNIRNNFGVLNRCGEAPSARDKLFMQNGRKVFRDVCPMVAEHIKEHFSEAGIDVESAQRFWLHQANINMNNLIARSIVAEEGVSEVRFPKVLDKYGNTSSAGSIIAFHEHSEDLNIGDIGLICSFGAGYSVGSLIVRKVA